jgi:hypothetical protein
VWPTAAAAPYAKAKQRSMVTHGQQKQIFGTPFLPMNNV